MYPNGDRYEGDWRNNQAEGRGKYYYHNGNRLEGQWKQNKMDGRKDTNSTMN